MTDDVFRALADPTRRAVLDELVAGHAQTLFEICTRLAARHDLHISRQAVSQHLAVLEGAGLVSIRREGRYRLHTFDPAPLERVTDRWLRPAPTPTNSEEHP